MIKNNFFLFCFKWITLLFSCLSLSLYAENSIEHIQVKGDLFTQPIQHYATSVSIINAEAIQQRQAQFVDQLLTTLPNVNIATGASRGRFFQIRGIGERSQFRDPINPSVGLIIDDIDFTGVASAGTLVDIDQIEVFRGPQGTAFGSSSLAGVIAIHTQAADSEQHYLSGNFAQNNTTAFAGATSTELTNNLWLRFAAKQFKTDGFTKNKHLQRDDTGKLNEYTQHIKATWQPQAQHKLQLNWHYFDVDNGYDAFSLDNDRTTLSDQPGYDRALVHGVSLKHTWQLAEDYQWKNTLSGYDADLHYAFDEDWTFTGFHPNEYRSFDRYQRQKRQQQFTSELLYQDHLWHGLFGFLFKQNNEGLIRHYTFDVPFIYDNHSEHYAVYSQINYEFFPQWQLTLGARLEQRHLTYQDNQQFNEQDTQNSFGGKLALSHQLTSHWLAYFLVSQGYKVGGVNANQRLQSEQRLFDQEISINYELGTNFTLPESGLSTRLAFFYLDRKDQQLKGSVALPISGEQCPCEFIELVDNADGGQNSGLEIELQWQATAAFNVIAHVSYLHTEFDRFIRRDHRNLQGRSQAHAPNYQYFIDTSYDFNTHWQASLQIEGQDEYYFSDSHEGQSIPYTLVNFQLSYTLAETRIMLYGKNIFNKTYYQRGFRFGNDPRIDYQTEDYYQLAAPSQWGLSLYKEF